jgi:hypothetical protein
MAAAQFDLAMSEILGLSVRLGLGAKLRGTGGRPRV